MKLKKLTTHKMLACLLLLLFFKANVMRKHIPRRLLITKINLLSLMRLQDGLLPFKERPSDKYENLKKSGNVEDDCRIKAEELFSHFTADIIQKKVVFIR